tara:strand:- start:27961 stop:28749 length:789 start_codon:yes stop_codon:yes gene_type:complete
MFYSPYMPFGGGFSPYQSMMGGGFYGRPSGFSPFGGGIATLSPGSKPPEQSAETTETGSPPELKTNQEAFLENMHPLDRARFDKLSEDEQQKYFAGANQSPMGSFSRPPMRGGIGSFFPSPMMGGGFGSPMMGGFGRPMMGGFGPPMMGGGYGSPMMGGFGHPMMGGFGHPMMGSSYTHRPKAHTQGPEDTARSFSYTHLPKAETQGPENLAKNRSYTGGFGRPMMGGFGHPMMGGFGMGAMFQPRGQSLPHLATYQRHQSV